MEDLMMKMLTGIKVKNKKQEGEFIMAMKLKTKTEVAVMKDRLVWLAGQIAIANVNVKSIDYANLLRHLGYKHNDEGKLICEEDATASLEDLYKNQYVLLCKKLSKFYEALDCLPDEKTKYVAELRYIEGFSWKEIAKYLDATERSAISYKDVMREHFIKHDCAWCLENDKYSYA